MKKIIIAGGNGFLGGAFIKYFIEEHDAEIFVLTRKRLENKDRVHYV